MKKIFAIIMLGFIAVACGPSESEQKVHEQERAKEEQKLEESWEDDMEDMMNDSI